MPASDLTVQIGSTHLGEYGWNINHAAWRFVMSAKRGESISVPKRDGSIWTVKEYEQRVVPIRMFVVGANADGSIPAGNTASGSILGSLRKSFRGLGGERNCAVLWQ